MKRELLATFGRNKLRQPHRPGLIGSGSRDVLAASRNGLCLLVESGQGPFDCAVKRRDFCRLDNAEHSRKIFRVKARLRSRVAACERSTEALERRAPAFG